LIERPARYENTVDYIHYDEGWKVSRSANFSGMSSSHSNIGNSKAVFSFSGTGITWIGTKSNSQGIAKVYIDGELRSYIDQFNETQEDMLGLYSIRDLVYGPHTIIIEVTNRKNPKSAGYRIEIDAFDIVP
jgi:hypothetical protein